MLGENGEDDGDVEDDVGEGGAAGGHINPWNREQGAGGGAGVDSPGIIRL